MQLCLCAPCGTWRALIGGFGYDISVCLLSFLPIKGLYIASLTLILSLSFFLPPRRIIFFCIHQNYRNAGSNNLCSPSKIRLPSSTCEWFQPPHERRNSIGHKGPESTVLVARSKKQEHLHWLNLNLHSVDASEIMQIASEYWVITHLCYVRQVFEESVW